MHVAKLGQSLIRFGIWLMGAGYLFMEAREVVATKQLSNITIFALLFILASHQLSIARVHMSVKKFSLSTRCYRASSLMFIASLMAVFDASLDFLISSISPETLAPILLFLLFIVGWIVNLLAVILTILSMELLLPVIIAGPTTKPADWSSDTVLNTGD